MIRLSGRTAVVTGASSGIGRSVALRLAGKGMRVALVARSAGALETVAASIRAGGGEALAVACDVSDGDAVATAWARISAAYGPADVVVNAAGFGVWKPFGAITEAEHRGMMATIYWGAFHWIRAALPAMRARRVGHLVNIAAASARIPTGVTSGYAAATAALTAMSESLHRELRGSGVGVSCLNPGSVKTAFWDATRIPPAGLPPLVRWAPKVSPEAVAREVEMAIRFRVGFRTFPVFVALLARANALWFRAGDAILSRWFIPALLAFLLGLRLVDRLLGA